MSSESVVCGAFHQLPNGDIAMPYGFMNGIYVYYTLDENGERHNFSIDKKKADATWILRRDVTDFPTTKDPRLPYVFDLNWDVKYTSELRKLFNDATKENKRVIKAMMKKYGIKFN